MCPLDGGNVNRTFADQSIEMERTVNCFPSYFLFISEHIACRLNFFSFHEVNWGPGIMILWMKCECMSCVIFRPVSLNVCVILCPFLLLSPAQQREFIPQEMVKPPNGETPGHWTTVQLPIEKTIELYINKKNLYAHGTAILEFAHIADGIIHMNKYRKSPII